MVTFDSLLTPIDIETAKASLLACLDATLPDSPYSVPGRAGTAADMRAAMAMVPDGLRRVEEEEARDAAWAARMGKP